jgi:hypothetical protein
MIIEPASIEDASEILTLQKLCYQSEAEIYNDYNIPPLIQALEEMNPNLAYTSSGRQWRMIGSLAQ